MDMRTVTAVERVTLDGVMQAPGDPDEDKRGGFKLGGWGNAFNDEVLGAEMSKGMGKTELLFGRQTYEILRASWADQVKPNPFTKVLNETTNTSRQGRSPSRSPGSTPRSSMAMPPRRWPS
jgi:dihydrofolate reductase